MAENGAPFEIDFRVGERAAAGEVEERLQLVELAIREGRAFDAEQHLHAGYRALVRARLYQEGIVPPVDGLLDAALEGSSVEWLVLILERMRWGALRDFELDGWKRFLRHQLDDDAA